MSDSRAVSFPAPHHRHDFCREPSQAGHDLAMWHQAAWIEPADELVHLALGIDLFDFLYAGRGRTIQRHRCYILPAYGLYPMADLAEIGVRWGVITFA